MSVFDWTQGIVPTQVAEQIQQYPALAARVTRLNAELELAKRDIASLSQRTPTPANVAESFRRQKEITLAARVALAAVTQQFKLGARQARKAGRIGDADWNQLRSAGLAGLGFGPLVVIAIGVAVAIAAGVTGAAWIVSYRATAEAASRGETITEQTKALISEWRRRVQAGDNTPLPPIPSPSPAPGGNDFSDMLGKLGVAGIALLGLGAFFLLRRRSS